MRMKQSRIISEKSPVKIQKNKAASSFTPTSCAIRTCISVIYTQIQKTPCDIQTTVLIGTQIPSVQSISRRKTR